MDQYHNEIDSVIDKNGYINEEESVENVCVIQETVSDVEGSRSHSTSNVFYTATNISNTIVGSGVVTLAYAFGLSGPGFGMVLIAISAAMSAFTVICLTKCGCISRKTTYQGSVKEAFGRTGMIITTICHALIPIFGCISYGIAISDNMQNVVVNFISEKNPISSKPVLLLIPTLFAVFPLSSLPNLSFLEKFSSVSLCFVLFYVGTIFVFSVTTSPVYILPGLWNFSYRNFLRSLGVYAFAMSCHYSVMPLFVGLKKCSVQRFAKSTNLAVLFALGIYLIVALSGFVNFGETASGNLFNNYCVSSISAMVARIVFCITIMLTAPLNVIAIRETIAFFFVIKPERKLIFNVGISIIGSLIFYIPGAAGINLGVIGELAGSLSAAPMVFILPSLSLFKLYGNKVPWCSPRKIILLVIALFGFFVQIVGTVLTIISASDPRPALIRYWCSETDVYKISEPSFIQNADIKKQWT